MADKKKPVQRTPEYVKEFFDPTGTEKRRKEKLTAEEQKMFPIGGAYGPKGHKVDLDGNEAWIPKESNEYAMVTDIKDAELPERVAKYFAKMMLEGKDRPITEREAKRGGEFTLKEGYDRDVMAAWAALQDNYPQYDQTKENAERLLWKMPLKGGPQQPSRKEMIRKRAEQ
jgi:hypothetical protein